MPIDLSKVQWDTPKAGAAGPAIDLPKVQWDSPRAEPSWVDVALSAPNQAVAGLADTMLNFPSHAVNAAKGVANLGAQAAGRDPLFQIQHPENTVENFYKQRGMIASDIGNMTQGQRIANTAIQGAALAPLGAARSGAGLIGNALRGFVGGGAGQTAEEFTGNPLVGMGVSIAAPALMTSAAQKAQSVGRAAQSQNAVRDATLKAAQEEGYLVTPGSANPTLGNVSLERLGGKSRIEQNMSINNQQVTNKIVRRDLGLKEDAAIDENVLKQIRADEYARGYEPVKQVGQIRTDRALVNDLARIKNDFSGTASFPKTVTDKVEQEVSRFQKLSFTAADAVDEARTLRSDATRNLKSTDVDANKLGLAQVKIANALEDQIERQLAANPSTAGLIDQYKASRRLMAKSHAVEEALVKGSGDISTAKLAQLLEGGVPFDAGLKTAAEFGNVFKHVNRPPSSIGTPGGGGMFYGTAGGAGAGAGLMLSGGNPGVAFLSGAATAATAAAARGAARGVLQSGFGQGRAIPKYERGVRNALADQSGNPLANALYYGGQAVPFLENKNNLTR